MERRISEIVLAAIDLEDAARDVYLREACADDAELLAVVRAELARALRDPGPFLDPPDHLIPKPPDLPEFELLEEIGRGGSGIVYRARQKTLARFVAVKLLSYDLASDRVSVERFHREARIMAQTQHPAIAQIFTSGSHNGHHFIAMELVQGHDLEVELLLARGEDPSGKTAFLPRPGRSERFASCAHVVATIAGGLAHAHKQKIVHRDVKPRNLLLQPDGHAKLVDFGIARDDNLGRMTQMNFIVGTLHYLSPEQAQAGRLHIDHRTDIYSLGVVLYELLTLKKPFNARTPLTLLSQITHRDPKKVKALNRKVPDDLALICAVAMHRDPERRYATADAFADDLRNYLARRPIAAKPDSIAYSLRRKWALHHRVIVPTLAILLGLLIGLLYMANAWRQAELGQLRLTITAKGYKNPTIRIRRKDPRTDALGAVEDYGSQTELETGLPVGYYRILVSAPGQATLEITRYVTREKETRIDVKSVMNSRTPRKTIAAGLLQLRDPSRALCPLNNHDTPVESFEIEEREVSIRDYRQFCRLSGTTEPAFLKGIPEGSDDENRPITGVSYTEAQAYAEWYGLRLPTLGEWFLAARGEKGRLLPWLDEAAGRTPDPSEYRGNTDKDPAMEYLEDEALPLLLSRSVPTDDHLGDITPSGLMHMTGNVTEWTESVLWDRDDRLPADPLNRYVAGGDWAAAKRPWRSLWLSKSTIGADGVHISRGFRCARSIGP